MMYLLRNYQWFSHTSIASTITSSSRIASNVFDSIRHHYFNQLVPFVVASPPLQQRRLAHRALYNLINQYLWRCRWVFRERILIALHVNGEWAIIFVCVSRCTNKRRRCINCLAFVLTWLSCRAKFVVFRLSLSLFLSVRVFRRLTVIVRRTNWSCWSGWNVCCCFRILLFAMDSTSEV